MAKDDYRPKTDMSAEEQQQVTEALAEASRKLAEHERMIAGMNDEN